MINPHPENDPPHGDEKVSDSVEIAVGDGVNDHQESMVSGRSRDGRTDADQDLGHPSSPSISTRSEAQQRPPMLTHDDDSVAENDAATMKDSMKTRSEPEGPSSSYAGDDQTEITTILEHPEYDPYQDNDKALESVDTTVDHSVTEHRNQMPVQRSRDGHRDACDDLGGRSSHSISARSEAQPAPSHALVHDEEIVALPIMGETIAVTVRNSMKRRSKPEGKSSTNALGKQRNPESRWAHHLRPHRER